MYAPMTGYSESELDSGSSASQEPISEGTAKPRRCSPKNSRAWTTQDPLACPHRFSFGSNSNSTNAHKSERVLWLTERLRTRIERYARRAGLNALHVTRSGRR